MLRNVNQSMVNRYISGGGGGNCRCVNGGSNGSDSNGESGGSGINGGKIELEFTIYDTEDDGNNGYIKKDEAEGIFNKILNIDLEKYRFYLADVLWSNTDIEYSEHTICSCEYMYRRRQIIIDSDPAEYQFVVIYYKDRIDNRTIDVIDMNSFNDAINYSSSSIYGINDIVETIPDTATLLKTFKIILYYTEI